MHSQRLASFAAILGAFFYVATAQATVPKRVKTTDPELRSAAALIIDQSDSSVLYERRADAATPIASITKLMTALVVLDAKLPLDTRVTLTGADRIGGGPGSRLAIGATLTRGELMHLALMSSENRAAYSLGRSYPGGIPAVVRAMNAKAKALGMTRTRFVDPTGLSPRNVASPRDLAKLVIVASRNQTIRDYSTDPSQSVRVGRRMLDYHNTNSLVRNPNWDITLQKTGYLGAAGRCLVMRTVIEGRDVVIVLLNSYGKYTRVADARRVRRWMESTLAGDDRSSSRL